MGFDDRESEVCWREEGRWRREEEEGRRLWHEWLSVEQHGLRLMLPTAKAVGTEARKGKGKGKGKGNDGPDHRAYKVRIQELILDQGSTTMYKYKTWGFSEYYTE